MFSREILLKVLLAVTVIFVLAISVNWQFWVSLFSPKDQITLDKNLISDTSLSIAHVDNPKDPFQYFQFILPTIEKNIVQCEKYDSYELSYKCYQSLAVLHKNATFCENIKPSFQVGKKYKDSCYYLVAKETQNVNLCENIENRDALTGYYSDCIATISKDFSKCPSLEDSYSGAYSCYLNAAIAKKDLSICDKFGADETSKLSCYENFAEATSDVSVCELIPVEDNKRDYCYSVVLAYTKNQDASLCEKIHVGHWNNYCKLRIELQIAAQDNNLNTCNSFTDQSSRNNCFWKVANKQNNPVLCELIEPDEYDLDTNQCVIQSSPAMPDSSLCSFLKKTHNDTSNKDLCYFQYGTVNQKSTSCEEINDPDMKDFCLETISAWKIYTNPNYKFSFQYPARWRVKDQDINYFYLFINKPGDALTLSIWEDSPPTLDDWTRGIIYQYREYKKIFGYDGIVVRDDPTNGFFGNYDMYFLKDGKGYEFHVNFKTEEDLNLFEKVISTFRFF